MPQLILAESLKNLVWFLKKAYENIICRFEGFGAKEPMFESIFIGFLGKFDITFRNGLWGTVIFFEISDEIIVE